MSIASSCDIEMSKLVRSIGYCQRCHGTDYLEHAHVIGRSNKNLRFDVINGLCLCHFCHRWAHDNPKLFGKWFQEKFPERYQYLQHYRNQIKKRTHVDWEELLDDLCNRRIEKLHYI